MKIKCPSCRSEELDARVKENKHTEVYCGMCGEFITKMYTMSDLDVIMPSGKYKGHHISSIDDFEYLSFVNEKKIFYGRVGKLIAQRVKELERVKNKENFNKYISNKNQL